MRRYRWYAASMTSMSAVSIPAATIQGVPMQPSPCSRRSVSLEVDVRTVLQLSATGMTSDEVAAHLGTTPGQVRRAIARAIAALGAGSKLEAVVIALRLGLIDLPTG